MSLWFSRQRENESVRISTATTPCPSFPVLPIRPSWITERSSCLAQGRVQQGWLTPQWAQGRGFHTLMATITCATWWDPSQYNFPAHPKSVAGITNIGDTNGEQRELSFHYGKMSEAWHGLLYVPHPSPLKNKLLHLLIYYHSGRNTSQGTTGKLEWSLTSHGIPSGKLASGPTDICIIRDYALDL